MSLESAERALTTLRLELIVFTSLVALGLVLEYKTALKLMVLGLWKLLTFRSTPVDRCALRKMCWHFLGALLVTIGVAGEFWIEYRQYAAENDLTRATSAERDRLRNETANANAEAGKANERASANEKEAEELRKELAWRTLTKEQEKRLSSRLPNQFVGAKLIVADVMGDAEGASYAVEIWRALSKAGWGDSENPGARGVGNPRSQYFPSRPPEGLSVLERDNRQAALFLQKTFKEAGMGDSPLTSVPIPGLSGPLADTINANVPPNTLELIVGTKPKEKK